MAGTPPVITDLTDLTTLSSSAAVKTVLDAKYGDASKWAQWAASLLQNDIVEINKLLTDAVVTGDMTALNDAIDAIALYTPGGSFSYTSPDTPSYDTVPTYSAPTLGTLHDIPAVETITIPSVPSTTISFTNDDFSDSTLTALKARLEADIATSHTGLGSAETALFARETARENAVRTAAYTEVTTQLCSRNFDMPIGALTAKQTEMNNESTIRLADSSAAIMAESARLAVDYNKTVLSVSTQLLGIIGGLFDSKLMRNLEAAKTAVLLNLEGFKATVQGLLGKADLNKTAIVSTVQANEGVIKVFEGQLSGQIEPMKAVAGVNAVKAQSFGIAVQSAVASLNAEVIPEELKIKGIVANGQLVSSKAGLLAEEAKLVIESSLRQLTLEVTTLQGLAQSAAQMVASSLNSVNVSSSLGFSGNVSSSETENLNVKRGDVSKSQVIYE
jgi:hypothetical protein